MIIIENSFMDQKEFSVMRKGFFFNDVSSILIEYESLCESLCLLI